MLGFVPKPEWLLHKGALTHCGQSEPRCHLFALWAFTNPNPKVNAEFPFLHKVILELYCNIITCFIFLFTFGYFVFKSSSEKKLKKDRKALMSYSFSNSGFHYWACVLELRKQAISYFPLALKLSFKTLCGQSEVISAFLTASRIRAKHHSHAWFSWSLSSEKILTPQLQDGAIISSFACCWISLTVWHPHTAVQLGLTAYKIFARIHFHFAYFLNRFLCMYFTPDCLDMHSKLLKIASFFFPLV